MAKTKSVAKKIQSNKKPENNVVNIDSADTLEKVNPAERKIDQREIQQRYVEMQMMDAQIKQIQKQLMSLDGQMEEIREVLVYLDELKSVEVGKELYVPITQGVFVKAELKEKNKVLMNVGSNVVVSKTTEEGKELINKQLKEVEKVREQMILEFQKLVLKSEQMEHELMKMVS